MSDDVGDGGSKPTQFKPIGPSNRNSGLIGVGILALLLAFGVLSEFKSSDIVEKPLVAAKAVEKPAPPANAVAQPLRPAAPKITDLRRRIVNGEEFDVTSTSATLLFKDYEMNEVAADARLDGTIIEVVGVVTGINKDFLDQPYVMLRTPNMFMSARMHTLASETGDIALLVKGQSAVFRCEKMRRVMGSPSGSRCVLVG